MTNEIILAIVQAATEFLPVSSSGHLALLSNLMSGPNLFLITILHLASLLAVLVFTRKELLFLASFKKKTWPLWAYWIIATIPAALFGYFFNSIVEDTFSNLLYIGIFFIVTAFVLLLTKIKTPSSKLNLKSAILIGLFQVLALFPGISRSGMTISTGLLLGIKRETAAKFSFLLFIPLALGATVLEIGDAYFSWNLVTAFFLCFFLSLFFLQMLFKIIQMNKFYLFSIYCFLMGILTLGIYFF